MVGARWVGCGGCVWGYGARVVVGGVGWAMSGGGGGIERGVQSGKGNGRVVEEYFVN